MKKMLQAGLIVSGLASVLVAALPSTEDLKIDVTDASVFYGGDGVIDKNSNVGRTTFKMTYAGEVVTDAVFDYMATTNNMLLKGFDTTRSDEGIYTFYVSYKEKLGSCNLEVLRPKENIGFYARTTKHEGRNDFKIEMPNCFDEETPPPALHFETEHPYANNTHIVEEFPPSCQDDGLGSLLVVDGETEKNYDFITISQDGNQIAKLHGIIHETVELDCTLPTTITFDSDYSITKSGVTVDLLPEEFTVN